MMISSFETVFGLLSRCFLSFKIISAASFKFIVNFISEKFNFFTEFLKRKLNFDSLNSCATDVVYANACP